MSSKIHELYEDVLGDIEHGLLSMTQDHPELCDYDILRVVEYAKAYYKSRDKDKFRQQNKLSSLILQQIFENVRVVCDSSLENPPSCAPFSTEELLQCLKRIEKSIKYWTAEEGRKGYITCIGNILFDGPFTQDKKNILNKDKVSTFYKLYCQLLCFVNQQKNIIQPHPSSSDELLELSLEDRVQIRDALFEEIGYIDTFLNSAPAQALTPEEKTLISSWKNFKKSTFFIYKHLKKYSIFMEEEEAFAVSGIFDPLDEMFPNPPIFAEAVLLPFEGRIIYDGLIRSYPFCLGSGIRAMLKDTYKKIKSESRLVTQL